MSKRLPQIHIVRQTAPKLKEEEQVISLPSTMRLPTEVVIDLDFIAYQREEKRRHAIKSSVIVGSRRIAEEERKKAQGIVGICREEKEPPEARYDAQTEAYFTKYLAKHPGHTWHDAIAYLIREFGHVAEAEEFREVSAGDASAHLKRG